MNKKRIHAIVNPVSGTSSKKRVIERLEKLKKEGYNLSILYTEYPEHATELASQAAKEGVDYVIAVGGDGTVNEVAKALVGTDTALGIIPHGSGNGLARHLLIPMNVDKAVDKLLGSTVHSIDYGIANGNVFFCTCGVGYDAQVSEKALTQTKRGIMMYAKNMTSVFFSFKPEKYCVATPTERFDGEAFTITCANASQYGNNAYIAPKADIQDGKMDIAIMEPLSFWNVPKMGVQLFTKRINNNRKVRVLISDKVVIERQKEGVMHLDGNAIYTDKDISVEIVHHGLKVLIP